MSSLSLIPGSLSLALLWVGQVVPQLQLQAQEGTSSTAVPPAGVPRRNGELRRGTIVELVADGDAPPGISASESRFQLADVTSAGAASGEQSAASIALWSMPPLQ